MKIAQLAPLAESVPPTGYGGTEVVVSQLTEELIKRGHEVTLFATADSQTSARLLSITSHGLRMDGIAHHRWGAYEIRSILKFLEHKDEFDVVHNHMGFISLEFFKDVCCPVVSTLHNPVIDYCKDIYFAYADHPYIAISDAYRRLNYPDKLNYVGRVYNAVDENAFCADTVSSDKIGDQKNRDYLLFLGRISHAKGTAESIKIAKAVGMPLKIAGKVDFADRKYYEECVEPLLGNNIEYVGEVGSDEKKQLYLGAKCVVYPINFDEPFGLVMTEALATGTPLLAMDRGSVREILVDKVSSIVGNSVDELIARFDEIKDIRSSECIARARHFSVARMTSGYEEIYRSIIGESADQPMIVEPCVETVSI